MKVFLFPLSRPDPRLKRLTRLTIYTRFAGGSPKSWPSGLSIAPNFILALYPLGLISVYVRKIHKKADSGDVFKHFDLIDTNNYFENYKPSEEVFPGEPIFAINNKHEAEDVFWTIPHEDQWGKPVQSINARAENVLESGL